MLTWYLRCVSLGCAALIVAGCAKSTTQDSASGGATKVTKIEAGADAHKRAQTALINAQPGETVEFGPGKFEFTSTLSCDVDHVTIRGQGSAKTVLAFSQQGPGTGGEGILITSKQKSTIAALAVEDAKGDAIKVNGCDGITFRDVRVSWNGGTKETNGGYGIYPVLCKNVLIEECFVSEASDAGIYVGQSHDIIVRRNRVERNVAGIEIENSINADVYENTATDNTGGILVFSLPDLPGVKVGQHCRVYDNQVVKNNHENFAPQGNIVASVPAGSGILILANRQVEVFRNTLEDNQNVSISICSYLVTGRPFTQDAGYDPYCEAINIHDNKIIGGGDQPNGQLGLLLAALGEGKLPAIAYDGVIDPKKAVDGKLPSELAIRIRDNGDADFVNFNFAALDLTNPQKDLVSRDLKPYEGDLPPLSPVKIGGVD